MEIYEYNNSEKSPNSIKFVYRLQLICTDVSFWPAASTCTYFASPADALPDTEIDQHPCNGECDS